MQTALKLVMDPPAGLQANLVSVMSALPRDIMAKVGSTALPNANELAVYSTNSGRWRVQGGKRASHLSVCACVHVCTFAQVCACVFFWFCLNVHVCALVAAAHHMVKLLPVSGS